MFNPYIPINCYFRASRNPEIENRVLEIRTKCHKYNQLRPDDLKNKQELLKKIIGQMGEDIIITSPFICDFGHLIKIGNHFYSNSNLIILDEGGVTFGDYVYIGPNCCITTAGHAIDPEMRKAGYEVEKPITIGNNVWIGAGCTILGGVTIGDNSVIGAGSVVSKDIPANVVAVGVPCKVLRKITEEDKTRYPLYR